MSSPTVVKSYFSVFKTLPFLFACSTDAVLSSLSVSLIFVERSPSAAVDDAIPPSQSVIVADSVSTCSVESLMTYSFSTEASSQNSAYSSRDGEIVDALVRLLDGAVLLRGSDLA